MRAIGMRSERYQNEKQELLKGGVGTIGIRSESYLNEEEELLKEACELLEQGIGMWNVE